MAISSGVKPSATELTALEQAFAQDPNSEAYRALAEGYLALGRFMEAMIVCKKGLKARPAEAAPRLLLARIYAEQGKDRKALEELQGAALAQPESVEVLRSLAAVQLKLGEQQPGAEALLRAHAMAPADPVVLELMGRYGVHPPAPPPPPPVALAPPSAAPVASIGPQGAAPAARAPAAAIPTLSRSAAPRVAGVALPPVRRAALAEEDGPPIVRRAPAARAVVDTSRYEDDDGPPPRGLGTSGKATLAIGLIGGLALGGWLFYSSYRNRRDHEITKLLKQTKDQLAKDDYDGYQTAEKEAQRVLDLDPSNFAAEAYLAYIDALRYGENGEGSDYLKLAQDSLAKAKARGQPHAYIFAAEAYIRYFTGDAAGAETGLESVLRDAAGGQRSYNSDLLSGVLGIVEMGEGKLAEARKNLVDAHNLAPADVRITAALGTLDSRLDSAATAAAFFQQALRVDADHVPSILGLALLELQEKPPDVEGVTKLLGHLSQLGAGSMSPRQAAFARFADAQLLFARGKILQAQSEEKVAMDLDANSVEMDLIAGQRLRRAGQIPQAIDLFKRALAIDPHRPMTLAEIGKAYLAQPGGAAKAVDELKAASASAPQDARLASLLGDAYQRTGDLEHAREQWQRAVALAPDEAGAHLSLARYWTAKGNGAKARDEYTSVAQRADGETLAEAESELGKLALARGDARAATDLFARALATSPDYAPPYFYAGKLLLRDRAKRRDGKKLIARYLALAPAGPLAAEARHLVR